MTKKTLLFGLAIGLALPLGAFAQPAPVGEPVLIDRAAPYGQRLAAVVAADDGSFIVAWQETRNGYESRLVAGRFDARYRPLGPKMVVNGWSKELVWMPPILASLGPGRAVVGWLVERSETWQWNIFVRRLDFLAHVADPRFEVATVRWGYGQPFDLCADGKSHVVVAWRAPSALLAQRFDALGTPATSPLTVAEGLSESQGATVGCAADGVFALAWSELDDDSYGTVARVWIQRFDRSGRALAPPYRALEFEPYYYYSGGSSQPCTRLTMAPAGSFAVISDGHAALFDRDGIPRGEERDDGVGPCCVSCDGFQRAVARDERSFRWVALSSDRNFEGSSSGDPILWMSDRLVELRVRPKAGWSVVKPVVIGGSFECPDLSGDGHGGYVAVWTSGEGIAALRFDAAQPGSVRFLSADRKLLVENAAYPLWLLLERRGGSGGRVSVAVDASGSATEGSDYWSYPKS
ncbi:MAG: hypothetical protein HC897_02945 [Thermoanaerobaculia bacterium]|nr:hypothetical protein [Thermoanaerobaculia bacterium]